VLDEALRNPQLDGLVPFAIGEEGLAGVRQAGLEITDDRAEKARREKPRP
jgi:hypothetical protein